MDTRLRLIAAMFVIAIAAVVLRQVFGTAWSNRCDPGNTQFFLMKSDAVVGVHPRDAMFTVENDGPDNSWLCSDASLRLYYIGPQVGAMFDEIGANMSANGWVGGQIFVKDQDFVVFEKSVHAVRMDAVVQKQLFWVEIHMSTPGLHPGERGF